MHTTYTQFLQQADAQFDRTTNRHPVSFKCKQGCHACCEPGLTVLPVEAENITRYINQNAEVQQALTAIRTNNPHGGTRCSMLNKEGQCAISGTSIHLSFTEHPSPLHEKITIRSMSVPSISPTIQSKNSVRRLLHFGRLE